MISTLQDLTTYLQTVIIQNDGVDNTFFTDDIADYFQSYGRDHSYRFWLSLQLLNQTLPTDRPLRILELGSTPYFFSAILLRQFAHQLIGSTIRAKTWPDPSEQIEETTVTLQHGPDKRVDKFPIYLFNFELDQYPFDTAEFDAVICMEVIEHLTYSPTHLIAEAHRILKPGGTLLLTTPNGLNMNKTLRLLRNKPIGYKYSGYGLYGRHNREFAAQELADLSRACGFNVNQTTLENVYVKFKTWPPKSALYNLFLNLTFLPIPYLINKRDYIFLTATATGNYQHHYPDSLYYVPETYPQD